MLSAHDRIAIVTGANNGIGFETAVGMAKAGCHVVMACRDQAKAHAAKRRIEDRVPSASLEVMLVDLGNFASVRLFADGFRSRHKQLDVLINNAGILAYSIRTNPDGIEQQFATNHLGHFLLTALLIDMMPDDRASRVVTLSSVAHKGASIRFDDLTCGGNAMAAYGQSKLACLMFGNELDRRLKAAGKQIKALSVHPGGSDSGLFDEMGRLQYYTLKLLAPFITHDNEAAAKPALLATLSHAVEGGDYLGPTGFLELRGPVGRAKRSAYSDRTDVAGRLWDLSADLTGQPFTLGAANDGPAGRLPQAS